MNIFYTDECPQVAASNLCDDHTLSQFKEGIQMLVSAARIVGVPLEMMPLTTAGTHHKGGYKHHPCTRWASFSEANWNWLLQHTIAIGINFASRFDNTHSILHKQIAHLHRMKPVVAEVAGQEWRDRGFTEPARAFNQSIGLNEDLLDEKICVVDAYREFYRRDKASFASWKRGQEPPRWWRGAEVTA